MEAGVAVGVFNGCNDPSLVFARIRGGPPNVFTYRETLEDACPVQGDDLSRQGLTVSWTIFSFHLVTT